VPDIGLGEIIVIVVIALLVFGPDRLPKVAADAARTLRQVRQLAASARRDLVDAAGLEGDEEMAQTMRDLRELDPRRALQDSLTDEPTPAGGKAAGPGVAQPSAGGAKPGAGGAKPGAGGAKPDGRVAAQPGAGGSEPGAPATAQPRASGTQPGASGAEPGVSAASAQPVAPPVVAPAQADPDWT
jgi:Tat protein translocase TatB subunit